MFCELFQAESNSFFRIIKIKNNNIDFFIKFNDFFRMCNPAPWKVCNVNKPVNATKVNKYTIRSDVFNCSFKYLTFFKFTNDIGFLCLKFGFDKSFVRNNNIFVKSLKFGTESQVTRDGKTNEIINGAPDWVYEEEFSFNKAFEWSPDAKFLAFVKFNETEVPMFNIPMFQGQKPELKENLLQ